MYSLRDSIIKPNELADRLLEIGHSAVAITDHGGSLGGVSIYKILKEKGIKYIHGCELYVCDDLEVKDSSSKYYHLVVLCKNETGRINLNHLISISNEPQNKYVKPRVDFDLLCKYKEGLIVTSACIVGEVSKKLLQGSYDQAKDTALKYKEAFGEDYFLEIQSHTDEVQVELNKLLVKLSKETSIPLVVTTDAHYVYEEDKKYQNKYAFNGTYKEDGEAYTDCYIQTEEEMREKLSYLPPEIVDEAIKNTDIISDRCNLTMPLSAPIMPKINTPEIYKDNVEWLHSICSDGFIKKLNIDINTKTIVDKNRPQLSQEEIDEYYDRYKYEFDALYRMGFIDYILLVYSYANIPNRRGIARGSGGGSLINFVTNITDIDPIEHGLYFERFIDVGALKQLEEGTITPNELKIPDIDLDFSSEGCKEVLGYLYDTYGEDKVASIGKFGTNKTKGTIRDLCKVLDINLQQADLIAKSFEDYSIDDIDLMISGEIKKETSAIPAINYVKQYTELFDYVRKLNNLPKSFGLHACGKVVATRQLDDFLPSSYDPNGIRYLQGDMHDVEDVGLVKVDVLGLRTIDHEYDCLGLAGEDVSFINPRQDYSDPKVLEIFKNGDTVGIFQMSSSGMKQTLKKMDVRSINDLAVANALFRPGSLKYIDNFCNRRKGKESFSYLHPDLEPILESTYGIMVFQEQLIEIGRLAGISNPDLLRKATGKKNPALLAIVKPELQEKLKARGWTDEQFDKLWDDMIEFSKYSFNKSHASAYAIIAYMTAKEKAYYPAEFYAALCNSYIGESSFVKDNVGEIYSDIERHNIRLTKFSYKQDHRRCYVKDGEIVWAIPLIKDCSMATAEILYELSSVSFKGFFELAVELMSRGVPKNQLLILIKLGFFSEYGNTKFLLRMMDVLEILKNGEVTEVKKEKIGTGMVASIFKRYCKTTNAKGEESNKYIITSDEIQHYKKQIRLLNKQIKESPDDTKIQALEQLQFKCSQLKKNIFKDIVSDIEDYFITENIIEEFDIKSLIATHKTYLGFANIRTNREEDRRKLVVNKVVPLESKYSKDREVWGYLLDCTSIGSGRNSSLCIYAERYKLNSFNANSIVYATSLKRNKQGYWYLLDYTILEQ